MFSGDLTSSFTSSNLTPALPIDGFNLSKLDDDLALQLGAPVTYGYVQNEYAAQRHRTFALDYEYMRTYMPSGPELRDNLLDHHAHAVDLSLAPATDVIPQTVHPLAVYEPCALWDIPRVQQQIPQRDYASAIQFDTSLDGLDLGLTSPYDIFPDAVAGYDVPGFVLPSSPAFSRSSVAGSPHSLASSPPSSDAYSDADAEGETDVEGNDHHKYIPVASYSRRAPRRAGASRRYSPYPRPSSSPSSSSSGCSSSPRSERSTSPTSSASGSSRRRSSSASSSSAYPCNGLVVVPKRNRQVTPDSPSPEASTNPWKCPHCSYEQRNDRKQDLKRHIKTHTSDAADNIARWVCCGVPIPYAAGFGIAVNQDTPVFIYDGQAMVGGCRKTFSRDDALKRHLKTTPGCVGDHKAKWLLGNRSSAKGKA